MQTRRTNPRAEYRLREMERVNSSVSLAEKFPKLKTLMVELAYFTNDRATKGNEVRYKVNVAHAKSVFSFVCPNSDCIGGDFDLSETVAKAVSGKRKVVEGEMACLGWRHRAKEEKVRCDHMLRYKLKLGFA